MLHRYQQNDLRDCLQKGEQIIFIGDSTVRQLYWATARKFNAEQAYQEQHLAQQHTDLSFRYGDISVVFLWDPYLNSSKSHTQLSSALLPGQSNSAEITSAIVLIGGGLWHARYLGDDSLPSFSQAVNHISFFMDKTHALLPQTRGALTILTPVQIPWYESLSEGRRDTITPDRVKAMNEHLLRLSLEQGTPVAWAFSLMSFNQLHAYDASGLHVTEGVADRMIDIIFNMKCNALLQQEHGYPLDKTCCTGYPPPTWFQRVSLAFSMAVLPVLVLIVYKDIRRTFLPSRHIARVLAALAMAVCYCYYADRTQLWDKAKKRFDSRDFAKFCMVTIMLGLLSIRRSKAPTVGGKNSTPAEILNQPFLSRDQTDEFKGWMQFLILTYHYLGASKILPIYEVIRLLVASYLFMTGYGHAVFFCRRGDYTLRRSAAVMIRLNMLSIILPYIMKTDYLFYYFAPLTSFWYIIVFLTMYVANQRNHSLSFMICKVITSAILVNVVIRTPRIFEDLFQLLEKTCNIHWNAHEWQFRLQLDSYIVYTGILCGILFMHITDALQITDGKDHGSFDLLIRNQFRRIRLAALAFALATPPAFYLFAKNAADKYAYNAWMPYISTPAILSFIIMRNYSRHARNYYSSVFAWMGRHSLETFTLQFHIWLAADTKGLLRTGMLDKWFGQAGEFVGLSIVFLWICSHVSAATQTLTNWIVDPSARRDEDVAEGNEKKEVLPRSKIREDLTSPMRILDGVGEELRRGVQGIKSLIAGDLRVRLILIVVGLWLLNIVSSSSARSGLPGQLTCLQTY